MISNSQKKPLKAIKLPLISELKPVKLDKNIVIEIMDNVINESLNSLMDMYKQGFIDLKSKTEILEFKDILTKFYDNFTYQIILNKSLENILIDLYELTKKEYSKVKEIPSFLLKIIDIFKVKIQFIVSSFDENTVNLYSEDLNLYHAIYMPNFIKNIYSTKILPPFIEVVLRYKNINIFYVKSYEEIEENYNKKSFKKMSEKRKFGIEKSLSNFKYGLEINEEKMLIKYQDLKPNFIVINPEIAYLTSNGILNKESRIEFYCALNKAYPEAEILLNLPRLDVLYNYHKKDLDFILDEQNFLKHYFMYIQEIEVFSHVFREKCKISIPSLSDDLQFKVLKEQINYWFKLNKSKINTIGMSIETDSAYDYLEYYKKFDFAIIELDRLYDEINLSHDKKVYFSDISYINQQLKIRKKEVYLIGKDLHNIETVDKLIKKGFKNFVLNGELYENFCEIVTNYNNSRGKYKKCYDKN